VIKKTSAVDLETTNRRPSGDWDRERFVPEVCRDSTVSEVSTFFQKSQEIK
jgi:hypothetical protein